MRKYEPIWIQLRENYTVSLSADLALHNKIIRGVTVEKCKDLAWKLILAETTGIQYKLVYEIDGNLIKFWLKPYVGVRNLGL